MPSGSDLISQNSRLSRWVCLLFAVFAVVYIVVRSFSVPVTYDEAYTIREFVFMPVMDILNYKLPTANNHLLNTYLIKLFYQVLPENLFVARLPNVIAGIIYIFFAYRITRSFRSSYLSCCCFLLLFLNPFLLDFFSLARGYGLQMACFLAALHYFIRFAGEKRTRFGTKALIAGMLGVFSGFSLLNFWLILLAMLIFLPLVQRKQFDRKSPYWVYGLLLLAVVAVLYEPVRKMIAIDQMYYGGKSDIYTDTFVSLAKFSCYKDQPDAGVLFWLNAFLIGFVVVVSVALFTVKHWFSVTSLLTMLLLISLVGIIMQHLLIGTPYIIDRTALYLLVLTMVTLTSALNDLPAEKKIREITATVFVIILGANTLLKANFSKSAIWFYDAHTPEILADLNKRGEREKKVLYIGYSHIFSSSFNYYSKRNSYPYLKIAKEEFQGDTTRNNYHVHLSRPLDIVYSNDWDPIHYYTKKTSVKAYPNEGVIVYRLNNGK